MKILVASELFFPYGGGAELATWLYVKKLSEEGIKISVLTTHVDGEPTLSEANPNLRIYRIPFHSTFDSRYDMLLTIPQLLNASVLKLFRECQLVYIPGNWLAAALVAKAHGKAILLHAHNYALACPLSLMYDPYLNRIGPCTSKGFYWHERLKRRSVFRALVATVADLTIGRRYYELGRLADAIIFVSEAQRRLVVERSPFLARKSHVVYNLIPDQPLIRAESKGIGYFGGESLAKGINVIMRALESMRNTSNINVYMTKMSGECTTSRIGDGVIVNLLPRLDSDSLLVTMKRLSIVVIPSLWPEPLPYTLIQSMLQGKLVIASRTGGIPEIVGQAGPGVKLVNPGDHLDIANGLLSYLTYTVEETNEIGLMNRNHVLRTFDNEKTMKLFMEVALKAVDSANVTHESRLSSSLSLHNLIERAEDYTGSQPK